MAFSCLCQSVGQGENLGCFRSFAGRATKQGSGWQKTYYIVLSFRPSLPDGLRKNLKTIRLVNNTGCKYVLSPSAGRHLFVLRTFFPFHRENSQIRMTENIYLPPEWQEKYLNLINISLYIVKRLILSVNTFSAISAGIRYTLSFRPFRKGYPYKQ